MATEHSTFDACPHNLSTLGAVGGEATLLQTLSAGALALSTSLVSGMQLLRNTWSCFTQRSMQPTASQGEKVL